MRGRGAKVDVIPVADQPAVLSGYALVVDAAFGLGCSRPYTAPTVAPGTFVVAVDLPSGVDADSGEMATLGPPESDSLVASATRMPIASGAVDVCFSSNVLEHVRDWPAMLAEMVRVTRPGGIVFVTFTNWLSPYGGHETSPWHYLGGDRAVARYQRKHGKMPKNRFGDSLYAISVAEALGWARSAQGIVVVDAVPRYLPSWTRPLLRVPMLREFLTWNLLLVLRREGYAPAPVHT